MAKACLAALVLTMLSLSAILGCAENDDGRDVYIVHILKSMKPHRFTSHHNWYASMLDQVVQSDPTANEMIYTYDTLLHGFAARLSRAEAEAMEAMEGCLAVIPSSHYEIGTTRTPEFLGLSSSSGLWSSTNGEDVIIGVIDTGIWPERQSFNDEALGPIPPRWNGACESGREFDSSNCNGKIIGARYYYKSYQEQSSIKIDETSEYLSPRDSNGHGTHTASTAAGAAVPETSFLGFAEGTARGMAPQARLAVYKACWAYGCYEGDLAKAMDDAVADGVDIISISIHSLDVPFYNDSRGIAAFGAMEKGVLVSASAGNYGPDQATLSNVAPWIATVGASSLDRDFPASVELGNGDIHQGTATYNQTLQGPLPLVYVTTTDSSRRCLAGSLDSDLVKGKIVVCDQLLLSAHTDENSGGWKSSVVYNAGGAGVIVANERLLGAQQHPSGRFLLPSITVSFAAGEEIKAYLNSTANTATAILSIAGSTVVGNEVVAPMLTAFSSRGPSIAFPQILKPDMIAPGLNILAAYVGPDPYVFASGTSMACPHVSGIAALIKSIHPTWSPAAIKSALMTSSYVIDSAGQPIMDSSTVEEAGPFALGAGHVDPNAAVDPGLVYDIAPQDYINFLCSLNYTEQQIAILTKEPVSCPTSSLGAGDLNYPSFTVVMKSGSNSVEVKKRRVRYVGSEADAEFQLVSVKNPPGVSITVEPQTLKFEKPLDTASYSVEFVSTGITSSEMGGEIVWKCIQGGSQIVRSPVAVNIEAPLADASY